MIVDLIENSIISGLIATNSTIDKSNLSNMKYKSEQGGLSGKPLMKKATSKISLIKSKCANIPIIGVGGVLNKDDFKLKLEKGADLVQIYTGFIIKGPKLIQEILRD